MFPLRPVQPNRTRSTAPFDLSTPASRGQLAPALGWTVGQKDRAIRRYSGLYRIHTNSVTRRAGLKPRQIRLRLRPRVVGLETSALRSRSRSRRRRAASGAATGPLDMMCPCGIGSSPTDRWSAPARKGTGSLRSCRCRPCCRIGHRDGHGNHRKGTVCGGRPRT